jgi:hypothetical protein
MGSGLDESIYWTLTGHNYNYNTLKITVTITHKIKSSMFVAPLTLHSWILSYSTAFWNLLLATPFHNGLLSITHGVPSWLIRKSKLCYDPWSVVELNLHSVIHLHDMTLNQLSIGTTLPFTRWIWAVSFLLLLLYLSRESPISIGWEAGWALEVGLDVMAEGKILSLPGIQHRLSGP